MCVCVFLFFIFLCLFGCIYVYALYLSEYVLCVCGCMKVLAFCCLVRVLIYVYVRYICVLFRDFILVYLCAFVCTVCVCTEFYVSMYVYVNVRVCIYLCLCMYFCVSVAVCLCTVRVLVFV